MIFTPGDEVFKAGRIGTVLRLTRSFVWVLWGNDEHASPELPQRLMKVEVHNV